MPEAPVAFLDWDRSLHDGFTTVPWMDFLISHDRFDRSVRARVAEVFEEHARGTVSYATLAEEVCTAQCTGVRGQDVAELALLAEQFVDMDQHRVHEYTRPLIELLIGNGVEPIVVSGAPSQVLDVYARRLGISTVHAVEALYEDGVFTGATGNLFAVTEEKRRIVSEELSARGRPQALLAVGDSEADLPLLEAATWRLVVDAPALLAESDTTLHVDTTSPGATERVLSFVGSCSSAAG